MKSKSFRITAFCMALLCFSVFSFVSSSYGDVPEKSARIVSFKGNVFVKSELKKAGQWTKITKGNVALYNGDEVRTEKGTAEIEFLDGSLINLSENTNIGINEGKKKKKKLGVIKVSMASFWAKVKKNKEAGKSSRTAIIGTRGPLDRWSLAKIIGFKGAVFVKSMITKPKGEWIKITKADFALYNGDEVRTEKGTARLEFIDGSVVNLSEKTSVGIDVSMY